jgi:hypothetical protein
MSEDANLEGSVSEEIISEGSNNDSEAMNSEGNSEVADEGQNPSPNRFKLSNGEEIEESELLSRYNYVKEANKRFQDAAAERRAAAEERERVAKEKAEAEGILEKLKNDPWNTLQALGLDPRQLSEEKLLEILEEEQMSPEAKRIKELEQKAKEYEEHDKKRKHQEEELRKEEEKRKNDEEFQALQKNAEQKYEAEFLKAMENTTLTKDERSIRRIADVIYQSALAGEELPVDLAVKLVEEENVEGSKAYIRNLRGDALVEFLGRDVVKDILKHETSKLKNPVPDNKPHVSKSDKQSPTKKSEYVDPKDFISNLKKKHGII